MDVARRVHELAEAAAGLAPLIRAHADENEREPRLAPAVVEAFHAAGLFRALVPERFGGAGSAAGITAIFTGSPLERCWRDLHAVSQHFALSSAHFERIGKIRLGLDPGPAI